MLPDIGLPGSDGVAVNFELHFEHRTDLFLYSTGTVALVSQFGHVICAFMRLDHYV